MRGFSPSVPNAFRSHSFWFCPTIEEAKNLYVVLPVVGPTITRGFPVRLLTSSKCRYVVGVTSKSPNENVRSIVNTKNGDLQQNLSTLTSC